MWHYVVCHTSTVTGRCLLWDYTYSHTLAASFLYRAVRGPSNVACDAERRKICKYSSLLSTYVFFPIAVETLGAVGTKAMSFLHEVGRRIQFVTHEKRSFSFLMQRLSMAIQRVNVDCIIGPVPHSAR